MSQDYSSICPNCFKAEFQEKCGHCGYIAIHQMENHMLLTPGTTLGNRYLLGRTLGAGGFGVTYLAKDLNNGQLIAVKEYLPAVLAVRDPETKQVYPSSRESQETFTHGISVFQKEADVLRKFIGNQAVVQIQDFLTENGTAYFTMEFLDGVNLKALTISLGGSLPVTMVLEILENISAALEAVHQQGLLHRDISPENIFITKTGFSKLIDFGATRFFVGERSRSLSVILKPGFAPPEQYSSKGNQGPWTDIYALSATIYYVLTGQNIPDAPDRIGGRQMIPIQELVPSLPTSVCKAINMGLELDYRNRPQTMQEFLALLQEEPLAKMVAPIPVSRIKGIPYIQMLKSGGEGDKWILPKNMKMIVGRSSEQCNIILEDASVSRIHCTVTYDEDSNCFYLEDLSSNGTFMGCERLEKNRAYSLAPGDIFSITLSGCAMQVGLN